MSMIHFNSIELPALVEKSEWVLLVEHHKTLEESPYAMGRNASELTVMHVYKGSYDSPRITVHQGGRHNLNELSKITTKKDTGYYGTQVDQYGSSEKPQAFQAAKRYIVFVVKTKSGYELTAFNGFETPDKETAIRQIIRKQAWEKNPVKPLAQTIHPDLVQQYCQESTQQHVIRIFKNAAGDIGGYSVTARVRDSAVAYYDADFNPIGGFHIYAAPEANAKDKSAIDIMRSRYPVSEDFRCPE